MTRTDYIVITQQVEGDERHLDINYYWNGRRFPTHEAAVKHGFTLDRGDDFNVGRVVEDRLTWFGWMDDELDDDLPAITAQIGLSR